MKKEEYLASKDNKQTCIDLLSNPLQESVWELQHVDGDSDIVIIVLALKVA